MGFSIDSGFGPLGALAIVVMISAGAIALFFFLSAARQARSDVLEETGDDEPPGA